MNEAPKKIWYSFEYEKRIIAGANEEDTPYIRADLVDGLVRELEKLITLHDQRAFYGTNDTYMALKYTALADPARAALKALEEE